MKQSGGFVIKGRPFLSFFLILIGISIFCSIFRTCCILCKQWPFYVSGNVKLNPNSGLLRKLKNKLTKMNAMNNKKEGFCNCGRPNCNCNEGFAASGWNVMDNKEEGFQNGSEIVLFYAPWCPHCKSMMPEWQRFEKMMLRRPLRVRSVDCDANPDEAERNDVQGFPTIILFKDGSRVVYEGMRDAKSLEKFVNENI